MTTKRPLKKRQREKQRVALQTLAKKRRTDDVTISCSDAQPLIHVHLRQALADIDGNAKQQKYMDYHLNGGVEGMRRLEEQRREEGKKAFVVEQTARSLGEQKAANTRRENTMLQEQNDRCESFKADHSVHVPEDIVPIDDHRPFVSSKTILDVDIIVVPSLSRVHSTEPMKHKVTGAYMHYMHYECLVGCLLGKRFVVPAFFDDPS